MRVEEVQRDLKVEEQFKNSKIEQLDLETKRNRGAEEVNDELIKHSFQ